MALSEPIYFSENLMKKTLSPKLLIFLIVFVNFLGYGIVFPTLPLLTLEYGGNPLISGILIGIFSLMQVIFMPILGKLSDRYGRRPLLLISLFGTFVSFLIMGATRSLSWLFIARTIDGASGGNLSIAQAYIADITRKKERAEGMGIISAGLILGFIFGPLWGGLFSKISLSAPYYGAAVITLLSIVLTFFFLSESVPSAEISDKNRPFSFNRVFSVFRQTSLLILFITNLLAFWGNSGFYTTLTLFGKDIFGFGVLKSSLLFVFGGILSAIIQGYLVGKAVKLVKEEKIFVYGSTVATVGMIIMTQGNTIPILIIGIAIFSVGNSFLLPITQSLVSEHTSSHEQGGTLGLLQSFGSVGRILGPVIGGLVYQKISPFSPMLIGTVLYLIITILGLKFIWKKR